jgi:hypothetical protein
MDRKVGEEVWGTLDLKNRSLDEFNVVSGVYVRPSVHTYFKIFMAPDKGEHYAIRGGVQRCSDKNGKESTKEQYKWGHQIGEKMLIFFGRGASASYGWGLCLFYLWMEKTTKPPEIGGIRVVAMQLGTTQPRIIPYQYGEANGECYAVANYRCWTTTWGEDSLCMFELCKVPELEIMEIRLNNTNQQIDERIIAKKKVAELVCENLERDCRSGYNQIPQELTLTKFIKLNMYSNSSKIKLSEEFKKHSGESCDYDVSFTSDYELMHGRYMAANVTVRSECPFLIPPRTRKVFSIYRITTVKNTWVSVMLMQYHRQFWDGASVTIQSETLTVEEGCL